MYTALQKIHKERDAEPSEFEENVAQVFARFLLPNFSSCFHAQLNY